MSYFKATLSGQVEMTTQEASEFEATRAQIEIPQRVQFRQAKTQMRLTPHGGGNLWDAAVSVVNSITDPAQKIVMEGFLYDSAVYERHRAELLALATTLGLSSNDLDALFVSAEAR